MDRRGGYSESPISATVFNDGACNNEFVIHYEGTTDGAQQSWDRPRSIRDRRIVYGTTLAEACGRRYFENQLCHSSRLCGAGRASLTKEDTAKPVVSVAILPKNTNFITKLHIRLLETHENNAINLDLNADTIFPDQVYLQW